MKKRFFDRIVDSQSSGETFIFPHQMTDVIEIQIINPWSRNLNEIAQLLKSNPDFQIFDLRKKHEKGIVLLGHTRVNSIYEIQLWPTIIYQWINWKEERVYIAGSPKHLETISKKMVQEALIVQNQIDRSPFFIR